MDAIELLTKQHRQTENLVDQFFEAESDDEREEICGELIRDLRLHTTIEEEIFYPAVRKQVPELEDEILADLEEHHAVEMLLDELEGMSAQHERFTAKFEVIAEQIEHHVQEEEETLFPEVQDQLDDEVLADLGTRMQQRYEELSSRGGQDGASKEELYQQARELGIEGRSTMSKRELAEAVQSSG